MQTRHKLIALGLSGAVLAYFLMKSKKTVNSSSVDDHSFMQVLELKMISFEGKKNRVYMDSVGKPTIGIGHLIKPGEAWLMTSTLLESDIRKLFLADISEALKVLDAVTVPLSDLQKVAVVSMAFNFGTLKIKDSKLVKRINSVDALASTEFLRWINQTDPITGKLVPVPGLINRRNAEKLLFDQNPFKA